MHTMKKRPWLAAILNLFFYGLGYVYVGRRINFGWLIFIGGLAYEIGYAVATWNVELPFYWDLLSNIGATVIAIALAIDGYNEAVAVNKKK